MSYQSRFKITSAALLLLLLLALATAPAEADPWRLTVRPRNSEQRPTPLVIELKASYAPGQYQLKPEGNAPAIPVQIYDEGGKSYLVTILRATRPEETLEYSLETDNSTRRAGTGVEFRPSGPNLDVYVDGKLLTVYRTDLPSKPYYYPVNGPTGASYTRAFPIRKDVPGEDQDHPHHRSLWFTHGDVNGVDFWASDPLNKPNPKFGSIRETSRKILAEGAAVGVLRTTDEWLGPDGKKVCDDERIVRFYDLQETRVIDFDVTIKATAGPVTFGDTKEGMFGLRVASSMDVIKGKTRGTGMIITSESVTNDAAWGKPAAWVEYSGPINGQTVGVAILNHPSSFRYPTTWHVRTYGLFAANPFGYHDFGMKKSGTYVLPEGEQVRFRYRIILHSGDSASARLAEAFKAYTEPPNAVLQRE